MSFSFKPQQQLALDYRGNVAVSAGAGSGKTRVLVEKYFRLLADEHPDWPVDSVVAITFTVKAANELRQRIIKRVREELADAGASEERRRRLQEIRREIAGAPIGTIHNFCSRTLREFAFDARLNPDFVIVEGAQESSLRREAVDQAIAQAANAQGSREYGDLLALQAVYSARQLSEILGSMLARRAEFGPPCRRYANTDEDQLFAELQQLSSELAGATKLQLQEDLSRCLDAFRKAAGSAGEELLGGFADRLGEMQRQDASWREYVLFACELHGALFTTQNTLRKALEKSLALQNHQECVQRLLGACRAAANAGALELSDDDRTSIKLAAMLARIYLKAEEVYGQVRSAANSADEVDLLDFTDLELLAEKLITTDASVRKRLRERVRYLIVDEFQDTSEVQWRILGPIVRDDDGNMLPRRFFMVGDPKQGVYGFRQASSRLFAHVRDLVMASNPQEGCRGNISITYNFRTLANPLHSVNKLFSSLMDATQSVHEVEFEALEPQRTEAEGETTLLLAGTASARGDSEPSAYDEAAVVADRIAELLTFSVGSSVAILLRKRKHFDAYEHALRSRSIAYVTHQGRGLYEQAEVLELLALMRLLSNPHDDRAVLEVCRGKLFNFPDDLLLKIALMRGQNFWDKCCALAAGGKVTVDGKFFDLNPDDHQRMQQLLLCVGRLKQMIGFYEVHELLKRTIELTGARAILGAGDRGKQALANLNRFVELTRNAASRDLDDFLSYVESEGFDGRGQGEATLHAATPAVQIMTIHAAKGLEFDAVFLPELAEPINVRREEVMTDGQQWLALQKTLSAEKVELFLTSYLENQKRLRAISEEKRVLYVAMTRCRDRLYLSATEGGRRQQESFYGWIQPQIDRLQLTNRVSSALVIPSKAQPDAGKAEQIGITLHDGKFEKQRVNLRNRFGLSSTSTSESKLVQVARKPFSPPGATAHGEIVAFDELLAAEAGSDRAAFYLSFREAFAAGAQQLYRGIECATAAARQHLSNAMLPATLDEEITLRLDAAFSLIIGSGFCDMRCGSKYVFRAGQLGMAIHADMEDQGRGIFVVPDTDCIPIAREMAGIWSYFHKLNPKDVTILSVEPCQFERFAPIELNDEIIGSRLAQLLTQEIRQIALQANERAAV